VGIVLLKEEALLIAFIIPLKIKFLVKYVVSSMIQTPKPIYSSGKHREAKMAKHHIR
jgi:hypothetical protein